MKAYVCVLLKGKFKHIMCVVFTKDQAERWKKNGSMGKEFRTDYEEVVVLDNNGKTVP